MTEQPQEIRLEKEDRQLISQTIRDHKASVSAADVERLLNALDELCGDYADYCEYQCANTTSDRRSKMMFRIADSMKRSSEQMDLLLGRVDLQLAFVSAYYSPRKADHTYPKLPDGTDDIFVNSLQSLDSRLVFLRDQLAFLESYSRVLAAAHKKDKPVRTKNAPLHFLASDLARTIYFVLDVEPSTSPTSLLSCIFREMRRIVTKGAKSKYDVSTYVDPAVKTFTKEPD